LNGRLLLWRDTTVKYSDPSDFSMWIPVGQTAVTARRTLSRPFAQPERGSATEWVYLDDSGAVFSTGQYVRIDLDEEYLSKATYNFYLVEEVLSADSAKGDSIGVAQEISGTAKIFTTAYAKWTVGGMVLVDGKSHGLTVTNASRDVATNVTVAVPNVVPPTNDVFYLPVSGLPSTLKVGDVVSLDSTGGVGRDLFEIIRVGTSLGLKRLNVGTNRHGEGYIVPMGAVVTVQPWVEVSASDPVTIAPGSELAHQGAVKLRALGYTGGIEVGKSIPAGAVVRSVDANDAGEFQNIGSDVNGEIFAIVAIGELGYILKERSIQSLQSVGKANGTFLARLEVPNQGPAARHAWCRIYKDESVSGIAFWGSDNIYIYNGGQAITSIGDMHTRELFERFDKSRRDEIVMYHHERDHELWVVYPVLGSSVPEVLVYDMREGSVTIDVYDQGIGDVTALGGIDWEVSTTWADLPTTQVWEDETKKWREYVDEGAQRHTIIGISSDSPNPAYGEIGVDSVPRLLLHGRQFSRASSNDCVPNPYLCAAETPDFDFGDRTRYKYVNTIWLDIHVPSKREKPMYVCVQVGTRESSSSPIKWSEIKSAEVSGGGNNLTAVNIKASGRYMRLRFFSAEEDAEWRIAGYYFEARLGGTS
jgi:hypothetical protein